MRGRRIPAIDGRAGCRALALALLVVLPGPARGSSVPDARGGVLYLSLAPELSYTDTSRYCGLSGRPGPAEAIVQGNPGKAPQIVYLLAAFPETTRSEFAAVSFGVKFPNGLRIRRWGICPRALNVATNFWPASGEGMLIGLSTRPDTAKVVEVAWLAVEAPVPGRMELVPHPEPRFGARFSTAAPVEAAIAGLGSVGFGVRGFAPAPAFPGPVWGAACVDDTTCFLVTAEEARYYGSRAEFLGPEVPCVPDPCQPAAPKGACCLPDGSCRTVRRLDCVRAAGEFRGDGSNCDSAPCVR